MTNRIDKCKILKEAETIAVVGLSRNEARTSRNIAEYLVEQGYKVYGINPFFEDEEIKGIEPYKNLKDIPGDVDIVDVFRRSEDIPDLIPEILEIKPKTLWLQLGIRNDDAVKRVIDLGINVIQDTCIYVQHSSCF